MISKLCAAAAAAAALFAPAFAQESPDALGEAFCAAVAAEDGAALAAFYTDDAVSYGPDGSTAVGKAAIAESWAPFFDNFDGFSCTLDKQGGHQAKKHATAWGFWTMTATPKGGGELITWKGRFMDHSIKTKEGWRYVADHASMAAPQP